MNRVDTEGIELRPMRWWQLDDVHRLDQQLFGDTAWSLSSFWSELAQPKTRWYVIAVDSGDSAVDAAHETVLGYAGLLVSGGQGDVQTLAVAPQAQGCGLGSRLLEALIDQARRRGASSLLLEVKADNERALALYLRHGFERIALRRGYYQPGDIDAVILRLRPLTSLSAAAPTLSR